MNINLSLAIGISSLILSLILYGLSAVSERRNRKILKDINDAIQQWQTKIMDSAIELMESRPEISGKRAAETDSAAKAKFIEELSQRIKYMVENQRSGEDAVSQSGNLKILLECFNETVKSNIPKEAWPEILKKTKQNQSQTKTQNKSTDDQGDNI